MTTTINSLRIEASIVGAENAISKLRQLEEAKARAGGAAKGLEEDTDKLDKSFANAARTAENLRRKYIDGYAAAQNFKSEVARLNRAIEAGAITSNEAASVLSGLKARMDQTAAGARSAGASMQTFGRSAATATGLTAQHMGQLQFQLNDIAMGLATGQSPFIVISQQGAQIAQMFGPGSTIRSAVTALGQGFMMMLNPINLFVAGLAASAAGISYLWSTWGEGGNKVEEGLKRHEELIHAIKDAYGEAAKSVKTYASESLEVLKALEGQSRASLNAAIMSGAKEAQGDIPGRGFLSWKMSDLEGSIDVLNAFQHAFRRLDETIASGAPDILEFRDQMARIANDTRASESQRQVALAFLEVTNEAGKAARAVQEYFQILYTSPVPNPFTKIGSGDEGSTKRDRMDPGDVPRPPIHPGRDITNPEPLHKDFYPGSVGNQFSKIGSGDSASTERERMMLPDGSVPVPRRPPNLLDYDPDAVKETKAVDTYKELMEVTDQRIAQMQVELNAMNMTKDAARLYRAEQELLLEAQRRGIELTPQEVEQLRAKAAAMAQVQKQTEELKDAQKAAEEAGKFMGDTLEQALMGIVQGGDQAKQAIIRLVAEILKGALLGQGAFKGFFKEGGIFGLGQGQSTNGGSNVVSSVTGNVLNQFSSIGSGGGAAAMTVAKMAGGTDAQSMAWNFYASKGLQPHQIAGIMGNIGAESGFNPSAVGDGGRAWGLYQHHSDRRGHLGKGFLGDPMAQHELAWSELQGSENRSYQALLQSTNVREATAAFGGFERPQGFSWGNPEAMHNWTGRLAGAEEALSKFGSVATTATDQLGTLGQGMGNVGNVLSNLTPGGQGGGGILGLLGGFFGGFGGMQSIGGLYAGGGIATKPSIFGEAGPEAAVPLPDGRSIPVKVTGPWDRAKTEVKIGDTTINIHGGSSMEASGRALDEKLKKAHKKLVKDIERANNDRWREE